MIHQSKQFILVIVVAVFIVHNSCNSFKNLSQTTNQNHPNIILFNIDDLGWMDTEVYGSSFYQTPNIKKLASMGMTFTRGYAAAANCAPSRACLMSGQNTPRHGIYTVSNSDRGKSETRKIIPIANKTVLEDELISLAEMLSSVGYITGSFGKWHLGENPVSQGFDLNVGGEQRGNPGKNGHFAPYNLKDKKLHNAPEGENLTDRLTQEALAFMKRNKDKAFFSYMSYYAVHTPIQTTAALESKYKSLGNDLQNNAKFAGMVETVDSNIGRILDYLESSDQLKNTIIIFTSDNGGIRDISSQHPLRAGKGSYYEGGIRVPLIVAWGDRILAGSRCSGVVSNLDLYPTLQDIVGSTFGNTPLDGESILPVLLSGCKENVNPDKDLFFHFPIYLQAYNTQTDDGRDPLFRTRPGSVIISGQWKLHEYFEDGGLELYDLQKDPGERINLISKMPEKAKQLREKLLAWREEMDAPIPTKLNPDYDPLFQNK